jgi:hypothetical protein
LIIENGIIEVSLVEMSRVTKSAQNILIVILTPKREDRRTYSIVEWTKNISVLPDK